MSKENNDLEPILQQNLQPVAPNDEQVANGLGSAQAPPSPPPSACHKCAAEVPAGAGRCPKCGVFQVANTERLIHGGRARLTPADYAAREALMNQLFRERGGRASLDIVSVLRIEDYATAQVQLAKVTRRLEALGAVSSAGNERKSLVATYTTFSARAERLAAELPPPLTKRMTPDNVALSSLTVDELIDRAETIRQHLLKLRGDPSTPADETKW